MTIEETRYILNLIYLQYDNSFRGWGKKQYDGNAVLWYASFKNLPLKIVEMAVMAYINSSTSKFAPKIGEIKNKIREMITFDSDVEALNAWGEVISFIHKYPIEETAQYYETLTPNVRRVLGIPDLKQLHLNTTEQNTNFEKPRFLKLYKTVKEDQENKAMNRGDLLAIADPVKVEELALPVTMLIAPPVQAEMDQNNEKNRQVENS